MATITRFEDLDVWKKARALSKEIYFKTIVDSFSKDFALKDQINAASGSVMDNIAEGFERDGAGNSFSSYLIANHQPVKFDRSFIGHSITTK